MIKVLYIPYNYISWMNEATFNKMTALFPEKYIKV